MQQDKDAQSYQRNDKKGKTGIKRLYNAFFLT